MKRINVKKTIIMLWLSLVLGVIFCCSNLTKEIAAQETPLAPPCPTPYLKLIKPKTAVSGVMVIIRGHRFGEDQGQVIFADNISAEIITWSNQRIKVLVPEGTVTGPVKVIRACLSESNGVYFKIKEPEAE